MPRPLISIYVTLAATVLPAVLAVIFAKGRENYYNNGVVETTNSAFQHDCIKWHNYFRQLHGAQPLQYSPTLAQFARQRAIQLATKDGTNFYHPDNLPYGENLAWNSQEPIDCGLPLKLWYDEWKIYNFQRPNISPRNGHFTQMVWKDSARIGCAQAVSRGSSGGTYTVCNYDPPGNYQNEELQNVSPAVGGAYYDFKHESRYRHKKLKIYSTPDGYSTTTQTLYNGKYYSNNGMPNYQYSSGYGYKPFSTTAYGRGSSIPWYKSYMPSSYSGYNSLGYGLGGYGYNYNRLNNFHHTNSLYGSTYGSFGRPMGTPFTMVGNALWRKK